MTDNTDIRTISEAVVRKHLHALLTEMEDPSVRYKAAWDKYKEDLGYNEFNYAFAHFLDHNGTGVEFLKKLYDIFFNAFDTIREHRKTDSLLKYATPATLCYYLFNNPVEADLLYYIQNKKINPMGIPENVLIAFLNYMKRQYFNTPHYKPGQVPFLKEGHDRWGNLVGYIPDHTDYSLAERWNKARMTLLRDFNKTFMGFLYTNYPALYKRIQTSERNRFLWYQKECGQYQTVDPETNEITYMPFSEYWDILMAGPDHKDYYLIARNDDDDTFRDYITPASVYKASRYKYEHGDQGRNIRTKCGIPNYIYHEFLDSLNA